MRVFVSYRHTGAEADGTTAMLRAVKEALSKKDVAVSNVFFDVRKGDFHKPIMSPAVFMHEAFKMVDESDVMLVLQSSETRSEGMLMEVGYALARQVPVVVATHARVHETYLPSMADLTLRWENELELAVKLAGIDWRSMTRG